MKNKKRESTFSRRHFMLIIIVTVLLALIPFMLIRSYQQEKSDQRVTAVFISKRLDEKNDFWSSMVEGIEMASNEYNIDVTLMGPKSETELEKQNEMILEAIAMKPDVIALVPSDYTKTIPYAQKIEDAGITLVLMDSVMEGEFGVCVIATDNFEGGRKMGEYLRAHADTSSVIGVVAHNPFASTAIDREKGVRAGLAEYEDQIVDVVYSYAESEKAYEVTLEMLAQHPDINMIAGLNEDSSVGAARAVKDSGRAAEITLIGFDSSMEQVQYLEEGIFDAIVVQKPLNMGYLGIKAAYEAALGEEVPAMIDSGSVLITKDTIYAKENEKLLFPFRQSD